MPLPLLRSATPRCVDWLRSPLPTTPVAVTVAGYTALRLHTFYTFAFYAFCCVAVTLRLVHVIVAVHCVAVIVTLLLSLPCRYYMPLPTFVGALSLPLPVTLPFTRYVTVYHRCRSFVPVIVIVIVICLPHHVVAILPVVIVIVAFCRSLRCHVIVHLLHRYVESLPRARYVYGYVAHVYVTHGLIYVVPRLVVTFDLRYHVLPHPVAGCTRCGAPRLRLRYVALVTFTFTVGC